MVNLISNNSVDENNNDVTALCQSIGSRLTGNDEFILQDVLPRGYDSDDLQEGYDTDENQQELIMKTIRLLQSMVKMVLGITVFLPGHLNLLVKVSLHRSLCRYLNLSYHKSIRLSQLL